MINQNEHKIPISVIIPIYNGEEYIEKCLWSIRDQSMRDLEIIVVNDGSTDRSAEIVRKITEDDPRVTLLEHPKNLGLFQARITGVKASHGDYIAFVDADDAVSFDWFRLLYETAEKKGNDITIGQFLCDYAADYKTFYNLDPLRQEIRLEGDAVFRSFISQEGTCYSWHLAWNKLYARHLWDDALPDLERFSADHPRLVMCEDIAFSGAIWVRAKKVSNITHGAFYYYNRSNQNQSTVGEFEREKTLQNINSVVNAFTLLEMQMEKFGLTEKYYRNFYAFKLYYARMYFGFLKSDAYTNKKNDSNTIRSAFEIEDADDVIDYHDRYYYFYSVETKVDLALLEQMEQAKREICSADVRTVSFDIFDTLILRPFWTPSDLFYLLNDTFNRLFETSSYVSFADIRISAEKKCREGLKEKYDDITIDEIYAEIERSYRLDHALLEQLKQMELALELRFSGIRKMGAQLYRLAKSMGKQVIATSDMYLPQETVEKILQKNGYEFDRVYLSSTLRIAKATKRLYKHIQKELGCSASELLHVGDNAVSDVEYPRSMGWRAVHLPRPVDLFCDRVPNVYKGNAYVRILGRTGQMRDGLNAENSYFGYRVAMALVANRLCDDPFETFSRESDFNADPSYIGYFALGQYLYAVTDWIVDKIKRKKPNRIHFVARDGYLPMEAYHVFKAYDKTLPSDNYLYVSRKALALADVKGPTDLYAFLNKIVVPNSSPEKLEKMFLDCYRDGYPSLQGKLGATVFTETFQSREQFFYTVNLLAEALDYEKLKVNNQKLAAYFSELIGQNDLMFDIGYSGRCESVLTKLLGYPIDSLYIHGSSQILNDRVRTDGFYNETFYDYKPAIIGVVREHVFMCPAPSTLGYEERDGKLTPVFEEYKTNPANEIITKTVQNAALDFVRDMKTLFGEYSELLTYQKADMSYPFEYYLHYSKAVDRKLFGCVIFEDDVGLGDKNVSALSLWNRDVSKFALEKIGEIADLEFIHKNSQDEKLRNAFMGYPKWKKALCYLILDQKHFISRLKNMFHKN
ncbi:MAG: HAD-IA family hydrolase [Clostridia bacterium]|nr:HAD-IA family hydrolase [Clostridia bacterium]